jgi:allophanate hydrolase
VAAAALTALEPAVPWPAGAPVAAPPHARVGVPDAAALAPLSDAGRGAFAAAVGRLVAAGVEPHEVDLSSCFAAGALLYGGAFVAERFAAVGRFIADHRDAVDPAVATIILGAETISAAAYLADVERLRQLRARAAQQLAGCDALLVPTAAFQPTLEAVAREPIELVRELGRYTSFANLLGFCALALPAGEADGGQFGVTLLAPGFHDAVVFDLARVMAASPNGDAGSSVSSGPGRSARAGGSGRPPASSLLVVGAHLSGQPLNGQLIERGGVLVAPVRTSAEYRLYRLDTDPPKPGLVRCAPGDDGGAEIDGEVWVLPPAGLAELLAALPAPMAFGSVALADGCNVTGFLCEPAALAGAVEITASGGWRAHLAGS